MEWSKVCERKHKKPDKLTKQLQICGLMCFFCLGLQTEPAVVGYSIVPVNVTLITGELTVI
jgi:hypothetical protein